MPKYNVIVAYRGNESLGYPKEAVEGIMKARALIGERVYKRRSKIRGWEDFRDSIVSCLKEAGLCYVVFEGLEATGKEDAEDRARFYAKTLLGGEIARRYPRDIEDVLIEVSVKDFEVWAFPHYDRAIVDPPWDDEAQFPWGLLAVFGIAAAIPVAWAIFNGLRR